MIALLLLCVWLVGMLFPIVNALIIAGLVAFFIEPVVNWLSNFKGLSRLWAARLVFFSLIIFIFIFPFLLSGVVMNWSEQLVSWLSVAWDSLEAMFLKSFKLFGYTIEPNLLFENLEQVSGYATQIVFESSSNLVSGIKTNLLGMFTFIIGLYFLLKDGHLIANWIIQITPIDYRKDSARLIKELNDIWATFIRVQIFIFFILAFLIGLGALFVIWLFSSGILPFSVLLFIILLILVYAMAQQVDNLWLHPQLMGQKLDLNPGLVFAGVTAALIISGILGAFLIVPIMASVKVLGGYIYRQLFDLDAWTEELSDN